ncbi:galactosyl transferase-like protein 4 [Elsinoe australis]|uniref:Galactosyl transferase-like protein 4 n=1 Tax=Elsinoe australis TaxID=40998 RepID=A0A4U7AZ03_9PEZI|nr:galactosyl transferase-like protein 4 [Elsinoe australis]
MLSPVNTGRRRPFRALVNILTWVLTLIVLHDIFHRLGALPVYGDRASKAKIAKVTQIVGKYADDKVIMDNYAAHRVHDERFGYRRILYTTPILGGFFDRYLFLISLMTQELIKPEGERLEWIMWHDSDIVMMNTQVPLEAYLPPQDQWSHVHLLVTNDDNGLNNGAFFIHVHPWSIKLLRDAFSIKTYEPNVDLEYSEQTALELWLLSDTYRESIIHVPQRWFNAFTGEWDLKTAEDGTVTGILPEKGLKSNTVRRGDLQVHFAGRLQKTEHIARWNKMVADHKAEFEVPFEGSQLQDEIAAFWASEATEEDLKVDVMIDAMLKRRADRKKSGVAGISSEFTIS